MKDEIQRLRAENKKLKNQNNELEKQVEKLENFVHFAAHDLRTPLAQISAYCFLLEEDVASLSKIGHEYVGAISKSSNRAMNFLHALVKYSTVDLSSTIERINIVDIITEIQEDMALEIKEKEASISIRNLQKILANPLHVYQIFSNLIGNSLKYSRKDTPLSIKIYGRLAADFYTVIVEDNGIGFDGKYKESIFGIFERLHAHKEYQGDGIGLALCRKIMEQYDGHIYASGEKGGGAKFTIDFPKIMIVPTNERLITPITGARILTSEGKS